MSQSFSIVANLAVLVGLVLVVVELDQNNDAIIGSTQQGLLELLHESDAWLQDPAFAEIVVKAEERGDPLSQTEARQFAEWMSGKFNACEHVYERYRESSITEYYWEGWDVGCRSLLDSAEGRRVWSARREWYGREFRGYIDDHVAATSPTAGSMSGGTE